RRRVPIGCSGNHRWYRHQPILHRWVYLWMEPRSKRYMRPSMADRDFTLAQFVSSRLSEVADPKKAVAMAAYMKTNQPFYGVPNPGRLLIFKEIKQRPSPVNHKAYEREVRSLWRLPHREERYLAIAYARLYPQFIAPESIRLYERMVRDGAWWDFVDEIAVHLMGQVLLKH